jgi:hypothetical protein
MTYARVDVGVDVAAPLICRLTGEFTTLTPTTGPFAPCGGAS